MNKLNLKKRDFRLCGYFKEEGGYEKLDREVTNKCDMKVKNYFPECFIDDNLSTKA
jgi:hypothetical protein